MLRFVGIGFGPPLTTNGNQNFVLQAPFKDSHRLWAEQARKELLDVPIDIALCPMAPMYAKSAERIARRESVDDVEAVPDLYLELDEHGRHPILPLVQQHGSAPLSRYLDDVRAKELLNYATKLWEMFRDITLDHRPLTVFAIGPSLLIASVGLIAAANLEKEDKRSLIKHDLAQPLCFDIRFGKDVKAISLNLIALPPLE